MRQYKKKWVRVILLIFFLLFSCDRAFDPKSRQLLKMLSPKIWTKSGNCIFFDKEIGIKSGMNEKDSIYLTLV